MGLSEGTIKNYALLGGIKIPNYAGRHWKITERTIFDAVAATSTQVLETLVDARMAVSKVTRRQILEYKSEEVYKMLQSGSRVREISVTLGLGKDTVYRYARKMGISTGCTKDQEYKEQNNAKILQVIENGTIGVKNIANEVGINESTLRIYANQMGIELPKVGTSRKINKEQKY